MTYSYLLSIPAEQAEKYHIGQIIPVQCIGGEDYCRVETIKRATPATVEITLIKVPRPTDEEELRKIEQGTRTIGKEASA